MLLGGVNLLKRLRNFVFILFIIFVFAQNGFGWTKELYAQFIKDSILLSPPEIQVFFSVGKDVLDASLDRLVLGDYDVDPQKAFIEAIVALRDSKRNPQTVMSKLVDLSWYVIESTKPALDKYRLALIAQRTECFCVLFDGYQQFVRLNEVLTKSKNWLANSVGMVEEFYLFGEREFEQEASRSIEVLYNATVNLIVDAWYSAFVAAQMPVSAIQSEGAQIFPKNLKPPLQPVELQFRMNGFKQAVYGEAKETISQKEFLIGEVVKGKGDERSKSQKTKSADKKSAKKEEIALTPEPEQFVSLESLIGSAGTDTSKVELKSVEAKGKETSTAQTIDKAERPKQEEAKRQPEESRQVEGEIVIEASVSGSEATELAQKAKQAQGAVGAISSGESGDVNIDALLSALEKQGRQTSEGKELRSKGDRSNPKPEDISVKIESLDAKRQAKLLEKTEIRVESPVEVPTSNGSAQGDLAFELISQTLNDNIGGIKFCYELGLKRNPALSGKVEVEFTIGEDGRVSDAIVKSSTLKDKHVEDCILRKIRSLRFPKPSGGKITVKYPFVFEQSIYF